MRKCVNKTVLVDRPQIDTKLVTPGGDKARERFTGDVLLSGSELCKKGDRIVFSRCQVFEHRNLAGQKETLTIVDEEAIALVESNDAIETKG